MIVDIMMIHDTDAKLNYDSGQMPIPHMRQLSKAKRPLFTNGSFPQNPNLPNPTGQSQIPCPNQFFQTK